MMSVGGADNGLTAQGSTGRAGRIRARLLAAFSPSELSIDDESARHAGHAGSSDAGETHYRVRIRAAAFAGMSRVAKHRAVNGALAEEFETGLHALALDIGGPDAP